LSCNVVDNIINRIIEELTLDQLHSESVEDRAVEGVTGDLEKPPAKNFPASWTFTQTSKLDEEVLGELVIERVPLPQNSTQLAVGASELGRPSAHVQPCRAEPTVEYQSDGEEDDLYLDVAEPSVLPTPTDACQLNRVCVGGRRWMLTLLQRVFEQTEVAEPRDVDYAAETATPKEQASLFGLAAKALPTPTLAVLQHVAFALLTVHEGADGGPTEVTDDDEWIYLLSAL